MTAQLVFSVVLIVVTMAALHWLESTRLTIARARRQGRESLGTHAPRPMEAGYHRRTDTTRRAA